jgi:putative transposase
MMGRREETAFMRRLTLTHAQRWKHAHDAVGHGHLYQGRFKSFPVQSDEHLLTLMRYVERNPVRAKLVTRAEQWRWGSCIARGNPTHPLHALLADGPVDLPMSWLKTVNHPQTNEEEQQMREHIQRNRPLGDNAWLRRTVYALGLAQTIRPRGRPTGWRKAASGDGKKI